MESVEDRVVLSATLFSDTFDTTEFDTANWSVVQDATIDDVGVDEPSAPYAARINGASGTGDVLESTVLDLSNETTVTLTYRFQRGGGGNVVEIGNDLVLQFRNADGDWVQLDRKLGSGTHMQEFGHATVALPAEALHANFQFRFLATGSSTAIDTDDWFVDDIEVRSLDEPVGEQFTASLTQTNNLFFPQVLTFEFTDVPMPAGDADLAITAVGDLSSFLENFVLRAEGVYIDQLFIEGGVDHGESSTSLILPQSLLEQLAADGTITFTATPSALVSNTGPSQLTLELSYVGVVEVTDEEPPVVESVQLNDDQQTFIVQLSDDDLDVIAAENADNYTIIQANGDANGDGDPFNDGDETEVAVASVTYNAETDQVIVQALGQLYDDHFRLVIDGDGPVSDGSGGLTDAAGNHLAGGDFTSDFDLNEEEDDTQTPTIADLKDATSQLDLPRWVKFRLESPLKVAFKLSESGNGHPKAVAILLQTYVHRLDHLAAKGKISEADREALTTQAEQIIDGLEVDADNQHHHHHRRFHKAHWKWFAAKQRWRRFQRC